jgi:intracellular multiplication protein IcmV
MAIKDIFKVTRKTFVDPAAWLGYSSVKDSIQTTWDLMRNQFIVPEATTPETFAEAMTRQNLTEEDIVDRQNQYLFYASIFLVLALISFIFAFILLFHERTFAGFCLGLAVTALFGSQSFRYHFWYFQIKQRRLGCTLEEWKDSLFNSGKGS